MRIAQLIEELQKQDPQREVSVLITDRHDPILDKISHVIESLESVHGEISKLSGEFAVQDVKHELKSAVIHV